MALSTGVFCSRGPGPGAPRRGVTRSRGHAGHTASYDHTPSIIDLVMDTPPYGYFISTRGESVETVGKNPVRTDGPVAPNASDVRTYVRVRLTVRPTLLNTLSPTALLSLSEFASVPLRARFSPSPPVASL